MRSKAALRYIPTQDVVPDRDAGIHRAGGRRRDGSGWPAG